MHVLNRLFRRKVIIGIHGLDNKPPPALLCRWWRDAITEGLAQIGCPGIRFEFEQVYWADLLHRCPLDPAIKDPRDPCYLDDPYVPGHPGAYIANKKSESRKRILKALEEKLFDPAYDSAGLGFANTIANSLIHKQFRDLEAYMRGAPPVKPEGEGSAAEAIRNRLARCLRKHRGKKICLIAHSMGTLVAYDTLALVAPEIQIHTLMTIGSPLGLPPVMRQTCRRMGLEFKKDVRLPAPDSLTHHWYNFSDLKDPVAANFDLADDYGPNKKGIGPKDFQVRNNYEYKGRQDHHAIYGYLRAPEVAGAIYEYVKGRAKD